MSHGQIRQAFEKIVSDYCTSKSFDYVRENGPAYTPVVGNTYIRSFLLPASSTTNTLGGDNKRFLGIFQVTVVVPAASGNGLTTTILSELQDLLSVFKRVPYPTPQGSNKVVVMTPIEPLNSNVEGSFYYTPARFTYRSDVN